MSDREQIVFRDMFSEFKANINLREMENEIHIEIDEDKLIFDIGQRLPMLIERIRAGSREHKYYDTSNKDKLVIHIGDYTIEAVHKETTLTQTISLGYVRKAI